MGSGRDGSPSEPVHNSLRSVAYGVLFGMLSVLLISSGVYFILRRIPLAIKDLAALPLNPGSWFIAIRTLGFEFSVLVPLEIILPPLFKTAVARRWAAILLIWWSLGWLLLYAATVAMWMILTPVIGLFTKADVLAMILIGIGCIGHSCVMVLRWVMQHYRTKEEPEEMVNSSYSLAAHLRLLLAVMLLYSLENGLADYPPSSQEMDYRSLAVGFEGTRMMVIIFWFLVLFLQHYARAHEGWVTYHRGRKRVTEALLEATLSPVDRRRLAAKGWGHRLLHGILRHRLTDRNPCCC